MADESDDGMQLRIVEFLDNHFLPIMREEWKPVLSIFEIGARPKDGLIGEIVIWLRSHEIVTHFRGLLEAPACFTVDTRTREGIESSAAPRLHDETLLVRISKSIETKNDGMVDLIIELFQVFPTKEEAEIILESMNSAFRPAEVPPVN